MSNIDAVIKTNFCALYLCRWYAGHAELYHRWFPIDTKCITFKSKNDNCQKYK